MPEDNAIQPDEGVVTLRLTYTVGEDTFEVPVTVGVHSDIPDLSLRALQDAGSDAMLNALASSGELSAAESVEDVEVVD